MKTLCLALCTLAILGTATTAGATTQQTDTEAQHIAEKTEAFRKQIAEQWRAELEAIEVRITTGKNRRAYRDSQELTDRMMNSIEAGEDTGMALALGIVLRALAAANLGHENEAIWHWQIAQQLFPEINDLDLERYGVAGKLLLRNPATSKEDSLLQSLRFKQEDREITPPIKKKTPQPQFPQAKRGKTDKVDIQLRVIVDKTGTPTRPVIVESRGELTMVYSALDTLREWKFEPAREDGNPVSVYYKLTVNFIPHGHPETQKAR